MSDETSRVSLLNDFYQQYLTDQDASALLKKIDAHYLPGTLERLSTHGQRSTRRAAVLALGLVGDFRSNPVMGRALLDPDRGVRTLAENAIRALWCRTGSQAQRRHLSLVFRLNSKNRYEDAVRRATQLIDLAGELAEAWNQRAIAYFNSGRFADSIRDCQRTLELNPYHFGAATGMGQCYLQIGDRASALASFRLALKLNPNLEGVRAHVVYLQRSLKGQE